MRIDHYDTEASTPTVIVLELVALGKFLVSGAGYVSRCCLETTQ